MPENYLTSGINFLYFGDFHHQEKAPSRRVDDFHLTEFNKVKEIQRLARQHNARAMIQPGDFLDKPRISDQFLQKILSAWNFKERETIRANYEQGLISKNEFADYSLAQIPLIGIVGNHEIFGGALKNYKRTSLKTLSDIGFMNIVGRKKPYIFTMTNGKTVSISGQSYDLRLLNDVSNFQLKTKFADVDIFMVHEALYNTSLGENMNWMPIEKVAPKTLADLTIAGHIHHGFGWIESNEKIFGNPGAIAQQTSSSTELDRDVLVTLIHVSENCEIFLQDIPLDTPRSREIFDLSKINEDKAQVEQLNKVKEIINSVDKIEDNNAIRIINKVAKTDNVDKRVVELAVSSTEEVMNSSTERASLNKEKDYRLSRIILENFESHLYTEIDLPDEPLPTVLIGESSHGKSSILRGIYWCLENQGTALDFIRRADGITRASVTLEQVDGTKVTRFVSKKKKRDGSWKVADNGWSVILPDGTSYETNTQGLPEIQRLFGLTYLQLDAKDSININFQKQEDPWFFIGLTSQQKAKVIGAMYGTQYILGGVRSLESKRRSLESQVKVVKSDIEQLNSSLAPLNTAEVKERLINRLSKLMTDLETEDVLQATLKQLLTNLNSISVEKCSIDNFLKQVNPTLSPMIDKFSDLGVRTSALSDCIKLSQVLIQETENLTNVLSQKDKLNSINSNLVNYSTLQKRFNILSEEYPIFEHGLVLLAETNAILNQKLKLTKTQTFLDELSKNVRISRTLMDYLNNSIVYESTVRELTPLATFNTEEVTALLYQIQEMVNLAHKLRELVKLLSELTEKQVRGQGYLETQLTELELVKQAISQRETEIKYQHKVNIGGLTIYGVQKAKIGEGQKMTSDEKLNEFRERMNKIQTLVIQAETRLEEINRRQVDAENKIRELGIEPENAKAELDKCEAEIKTLENTIETNLSKIEEVADSMTKKS